MDPKEFTKDDANNYKDASEVISVPSNGHKGSNGSIALVEGNNAITLKVTSETGGTSGGGSTAGARQSKS